MATINASLPTLQDLVSRTKPGGGIDQIVEILGQRNAVLQDMPWREGNLTTGHQYTSRKSLPSGTWRRMNEGVAPTKSRTDQVTETCGMLDAMSKVDCALVDLNSGGDAASGAAFRASEDSAFMQGLSNDLETAIFYSSTKTDPEKILGFSPRLDSTTGLWGGQIVDSQIAAAGSDQASMWCIGWGAGYAYGIYPKGTTAGLTSFDGGKQLTTDSGGTNQFWAYVTSWSWKVGLCIEDARAVVRLANIDTSAIAETGSLLIQDMVKMVAQCRAPGAKKVIYTNQRIATYLNLQALDSTKNSTLKIENIGGENVTSFLGIPVRVTDALTNTEAIIT